MPLKLDTQTEAARRDTFHPDAMKHIYKTSLEAFIVKYGQNIRRYGVSGTAEQTAFLAFQAYCQLIEDKNFLYSFQQTGTPWQMEGYDNDGRMNANCLNLAAGFNILLFHLGFPMECLHTQQSLPLSDNGKISQKSGIAINGVDVRGIASIDAPSPFAAAIYPQDRIRSTNSLHIRRGQWWLGRHYHEQVITKSHRDVFHNHWCCHITLPGFAYPYFDPLMASRYRNGQDDMFEAFAPLTTLTYKTNPPSQVYRAVDEPQAMLYVIPPKFHDVTTNQTYLAMRAATALSAPQNAAIDMYWRIDPGIDWFDRNIAGGRRDMMPFDAKPHPLFVQQLFHLCETNRWTGSVSYPHAADLPV